MGNESENKDQQPTTDEKKEEPKEEVNDKKEEKDQTKSENKTDSKEAAKGETQTQNARPTCHKPDYEKDVVYLYQFFRTPVIPSLSPFCLKLETWLRLTEIKYENVDHKMKFRSKKGQLPFIEMNGEEIADSAIIMNELTKKFSKDLDASLTTEQKNISHAMGSMIENHLLWCLRYWAYNNPAEFLSGTKVDLQKVLARQMPNFILNFFFKLRLKKGLKKVKAHGLGVHKPEEILEFGKKDLTVLSEMLGDKPFFFGDDPANLDVVAFSCLAEILFIDESVAYSLRDWMKENCANLVGFVNRVKDRAFPDWEEMCKTLDMNTHLPKPPPEEKKEEKEKEDKGKDEKESEKKDEKKEEKETEKEKEKKDEKDEKKEEKK